MQFELSDRLKQLPPYLFAEIDKSKRKARDEGRDIIDLGVGDPDQATPQHIINALNEASLEPSNHHYALDQGLGVLRQAIAKWYKHRFNVTLEPETEILPLIGSKEGIAHIPLAFVNPQDVVLIPEPCYPPYKSGAIFAQGAIHPLPLLDENDFLPDIESISQRIARKSRLLFLNYPNNPTASIANEDFFKTAIQVACDYNILICHDAAYSEIYFEKSPISILQIDGAKEVAVEFHSLSKTYCMTGWRIGWVCGNSEAVSALAKVKSNIDSGIFQAIQIAGIAALNSDESHTNELRKTYKERRDILVDGLNHAGWLVKKPEATFYVWAKLPQGRTSSLEFADILLKEVDVVVTPGIGFGLSGEGYIRMALTVPKERLEEAVERIKRVL